MPRSETDRASIPAGLGDWLARHDHPPDRLLPLAGDVSARRYWRSWSTAGSAIVAVYPADMQATCERFRATSVLLEGIGVRVPRILAADCERGWMLLEDVGELTLYELAGDDDRQLRRRLDRAMKTARRIAALPRGSVAALNPALDSALLERELAQTWSSFLAPRGLTGEAADAAGLSAAFEQLCHRLGELPAVPCHRDFMARNLVPLATGELAVLDHQDLRLGPPLYDPASLLNDSLFPPAAEVAELLAGYGIETPADLAAYRRAAAQRGLKAVGTFATFAARGNRRHLHLIPPTLGRALEHLEALPETAAAVAPLADRWRELIAAGLLD